MVIMARFCKRETSFRISTPFLYIVPPLSDTDLAEDIIKTEIIFIIKLVLC